jgi:hypothetical protein
MILLARLIALGLKHRQLLSQVLDLRTQGRDSEGKIETEEEDENDRHKE